MLSKNAAGARESDQRGRDFIASRTGEQRPATISSSGATAWRGSQYCVTLFIMNELVTRSVIARYCKKMKNIQAIR